MPGTSSRRLDRRPRHAGRACDPHHPLRALEPALPTLRTLQSVVNQVPDLMVIATGMTLVLIAGGIDLSVGSVLALSGVVLGIAMADWGWPLVPAIVLCLAVGAACGLANGLVSALWSIPSFIVTLGMLEIARGTAYLVTDSQTKYIGPRIEGVARPLAGLGVSPAFLVAIVVVLIGQILLTRTVWGRYIVAVGANEQAAGSQESPPGASSWRHSFSRVSWPHSARSFRSHAYPRPIPMAGSAWSSRRSPRSSSAAPASWAARARCSDLSWAC